MADEPVSRILRAMLKNQNLLIPFLDSAMMSILALTRGFLSHFLSQFLGEATVESVLCPRSQEAEKTATG
jgi:hypothetical protein